MKSDIAKSFGKTLQVLRVGAGLSQLELSEKAGCDRIYYSLMERGLVDPAFLFFAPVAHVLNVEPFHLWKMALRRAKVLAEEISETP
jgi:transcriptional regulator with XRE-family HTH domain